MNDIQQYKYICDKCNFKVNTKARWEAHIKTEIHKTGKRKKRCDYKDPLKCDFCEYVTKNKTTLKKHILNKHKTKDDRHKDFKYYCVGCDFGTFSQKTFEIHNNSDKHKHYLYVLETN